MMLKNLKAKVVVSGLVLLSSVASAMASKGDADSQEALTLAEKTTTTFSKIAVYIVGGVYFLFILVALAVTGSFTIKAYKNAKQQDAGDPAVAAAKTLGMFSLGFVILGMLLTYLVDYWLQGNLRNLVSKMLGLT